MPSQMRADGLYIPIEVRIGEIEWVRIADPFTTPARVSDPRTGGSYGLHIEFTDEQKRQKTTVIPAAAFHGNPREICAILGALGLYINRRHQDELIGHLQNAMQGAPSADLALSPGWLTSSVYVLSDRIFGDQANGRKVYFGGETAGDTAPTRGLLADWQREVGQMCRGNSRLVLSACAALAGPVMAEAGENSGGVHLYGGTTTGKTTVLLVGGSTRGGPISNWRMSANGLEPLLAGQTDGTVFLDEIGQADARAIAELIYTASNNVGKHRMTRELKAAPSLRWRVMIMSSGEHTLEAYARRAGINLPGGAAVRIIDVPADAGKGMGVFEDLHGSTSAGVFADRLRASALQHYGVPLREFLAGITRMPPESRRAVVQAHHDDFLRACNLADAGPEVRRAANRMAVIAAAGELAIDLDILPWPMGTAADGVRACFSSWRDSRGGDAVAHDDARAIEAVRLFLERYGDSRFDRIAGPVGLCPDEADRRPVIDRAGWRRGDRTEWLIQPEFFRKELCRGFDASAVARALHSAGYLRRQGRHWTIRTTISGAGKREVYCILTAILAGSPAGGDQ